MNQTVRIYQEVAAMEVPIGLSAEHISKILVHLNTWNGAPIDGMMEFLMSGRDCDIL